MAIKQSPAQYIHTCDCCGREAQNASARRKTGWSRLVLSQDLCDFQGNAVADGTIQRDLCVQCTEDVIKAINSVQRPDDV